MKPLRLLIMLLCLSGYAASANPQTMEYQETVDLFLNARKKYKTRLDSAQRRGTLMDPPYTAALFHQSFSEVSPSLFTHTSAHKQNLLRMLADTSIKKDTYFGEDVIKVLYALCMDEYAPVIGELYKLYKQKTIVFRTFEKSIFQYWDLSLDVCKQYENQNLVAVLTEIHTDFSLSKKKNEKEMSKEIEHILSGGWWRSEGKDFNKYQKPLLNPACN